MYVPLLFLLFALFAVSASYLMRAAGKRYADKLGDMSASDRKANSSRKKELPSDIFFVPDLDALPFIKEKKEQNESENAENKAEGETGNADSAEPGENAAESQDGETIVYGKNKEESDLAEAIVKHAAKKMLKFNRRLSNNEIKTTYGATNLEIVTEYEENFETYIYMLNDLAKYYADAGRKAEAVETLKECVRMGSDVSRTYIMLADIYADMGDHDSLLDLNERVYDVFMPPVTQNKVLAYIRNKFGEKDE